MSCWTLQRVFLGTLPDKWKELPDINGRRIGRSCPLAIIVIFLGIYPAPMLNLMNTSANYLVDFVREGANAAVLGR